MKILLALALGLAAVLLWLVRQLLRVTNAPARERARDAERDEAARLEPGGSAERALVVETASIVEPRALALGCARCGGELRLEDHRVERGAELRVVVGKCKRCAALREVFVRIAAVH